MRSILALLLVLNVACSGDSIASDSGMDGGLDGAMDASADSATDAAVDAGKDAGIDAGPKDASVDASAEAGVDAGPDAGPDAAVDAGPVCECSSGPCCDGCHYRPSSYICQGYTVTAVDCVGKSVCTAYGLIIQTVEAQRQCTGWKATCDGLWVNEVVSYVNCDSDRGFPPYARCVVDGPTAAHCATGPNCTTETP